MSLKLETSSANNKCPTNSPSSRHGEDLCAGAIVSSGGEKAVLVVLFLVSPVKQTVEKSSYSLTTTGTAKFFGLARVNHDLDLGVDSIKPSVQAFIF